MFMPIFQSLYKLYVRVYGSNLMERMDNLELESNNKTLSDSTTIISSSDDNCDDDSPSTGVAGMMEPERKIDDDIGTSDSKGKRKSLRRRTFYFGHVNFLF